MKHGGVLALAEMGADAKNGGAREAAWCSGEVQAGTGSHRSTTGVGHKSKTRQDKTIDKDARSSERSQTRSERQDRQTQRARVVGVVGEGRIGQDG